MWGPHKRRTRGATFNLKVGFVFMTHITGRHCLLLFRFFELFSCIDSRFLSHVYMLVGMRTLDNNWAPKAWMSLVHKLEVGVPGRSTEDCCRPNKPMAWKTVNPRGQRLGALCPRRQQGKWWAQESWRDLRLTPCCIFFMSSLDTGPGDCGWPWDGTLTLGEKG